MVALAWILLAAAALVLFAAAFAEKPLDSDGWKGATLLLILLGALLAVDVLTHHHG